MISPERIMELLESELPKTRIPNGLGNISATAYRSDDGREHFVCWEGTLEMGKRVPVRMHKDCLVGLVFSYECKCPQELDESRRYLKRRGEGVLILITTINGAIDISQDGSILCPKLDENDYQIREIILEKLGVKREED